MQRQVMNVNSNTSFDALAISEVHSVGLSGSDLAIAILEQSPDCIKMLSLDGHLNFINCNGLEAMEIDRPDSVIGKHWWDLWPKPVQGFVKQKFCEALKGHETSFEAECPTAKGTKRKWVVNLRPLVAAAGPVVCILSTSRDVTV